MHGAAALPQPAAHLLLHLAPLAALWEEAARVGHKQATLLSAPRNAAAAAVAAVAAAAAAYQPAQQAIWRPLLDCKGSQQCQQQH